MASPSFLDYARLLAEQGDLPAAEEALRVLLRMPGRHPEAALALAGILQRLGQPAESMTLLKAYAENKECGDQLRELLVGESEFEQARALVATRERTPSASGWLDAALLLQLDGDLEGAIAACDAALALEPDNAYALNALGRARFNAGAAGVARDLFEKATRLRPLFAEGWHNLGHVLRSMDELQGAVEAYGRALSCAPSHRSSRRNLAVTLMMAKQAPDALPLLQALIEEDAKDFDALINHGICLQLLGRLDEAERRLRALHEGHPGNFALHAQLGRLLYRSQRPEEAVTLLSQALDLRPRETQLRLELAGIIMQLGNRQKSEKVIQAGLALDPGNAELAVMLGRMTIHRVLGRGSA